MQSACSPRTTLQLSMRPTPSRRRSTILLSLLLFAAPVAAEVLHHRLDVPAGGTLRLEAEGAEVRIETTNSTGVRVDFQRGTDSEERILADYDLAVERDGDTVIVKAKRKRQLSTFFSLFKRELEIDIEMPNRFDAELVTSGGSIIVEDLDGRLDATTSGGSVRLAHIGGVLNATTSGGSITVEECSAESRLTTSGGSIRIDRADGKVIARTSGGTIEIDDARAAVVASTSGGSLQANFRSQPQDDSSFTTSGGSITIALAPNVGIDLDASSSGGRVSTEFDVMMQAGASRNKNSLSGAIQGGGASLKLRTAGGSIRVRRF